MVCSSWRDVCPKSNGSSSARFLHAQPASEANEAAPQSHAPLSLRLLLSFDNTYYMYMAVVPPACPRLVVVVSQHGAHDGQRLLEQRLRVPRHLVLAAHLQVAHVRGTALNRRTKGQHI